MVFHEDEFERACEEYKQEAQRICKESLKSCYMQTEQGMVKIKEWQPPLTIAILKEIESSGTKSTRLSYFVSDYLKSFMDEEDSVDSISVVQKSVIEKPTNAIIDPCNNLPICDCCWSR